MINITNPYTTASYSTVLSIYRGGLLVQQGTMTNKATTNILSFSITPTQNITSIDTSTLMNIKTTTRIPTGGYLTLQYPITINPNSITSPTISQCRIGTNSVVGCSYSLSSSILTFNSLFNSVFEPGDITISFSQLTTPQTVQSISFTLTTYSSDGSKIDVGTYFLAVNPTPITTFSL